MTIDSNGNIETREHNLSEIHAGQSQAGRVDCVNGILERMYRKVLLGNLLYLAWDTNVLPNILLHKPACLLDLDLLLSTLIKMPALLHCGLLTKHEVVCGSKSREVAWVP